MVVFWSHSGVCVVAGGGALCSLISSRDTRIVNLKSGSVLLT